MLCNPFILLIESVTVCFCWPYKPVWSRFPQPFHSIERSCNRFFLFELWRVALSGHSSGQNENGPPMQALRKFFYFYCIELREMIGQV